MKIFKIFYLLCMLLVIFCVINLINYVDRGAIASNGVNGSLGSCTESGVCTSGTGIQGDFNLNNFEDGILSSAFMVRLLVASPVFAFLAKSVNPFRLIGVGLSVWTFAAAGCGVSFNFWSITICRMLVGVGEASFISLAAPFIDDNAPVAQKTAWLAIFYMCIPGGIAFGYVYGGLVGTYFSWRLVFFGEAILMLPFAVLGFVMKPLQLKGFSPAAVENHQQLPSQQSQRRKSPPECRSMIQMLTEKETVITIENAARDVKGVAKIKTMIFLGVVIMIGGEIMIGIERTCIDTDLDPAPRIDLSALVHDRKGSVDLIWHLLHQQC